MSAAVSPPYSGCQVKLPQVPVGLEPGRGRVVAGGGPEPELDWLVTAEAERPPGPRFVLEASRARDPRRRPGSGNPRRREVDLQFHRLTGNGLTRLRLCCRRTSRSTRRLGAVSVSAVSDTNFMLVFILLTELWVLCGICCCWRYVACKMDQLDRRRRIEIPLSGDTQKTSLSGSSSDPKTAL